MATQRPTIASLLVALIFALTAANAGATDVVTPAPVPVDPTLTFHVQQDEGQRVRELLFEAMCVREHYPRAHKNAGYLRRLLGRHGFDEARLRKVVKKHFANHRELEKELETRVNQQCTPSVAREIYTRPG